MKINIKSVYVLLTVLFVGCNNTRMKEDIQGATVLSFNVNDVKTETNFINSIDSIRFVVLKDNTIKGVSKILAYDSSYYVLDKMQNAVSIFDEDGNLKYKLSKKGRSRQEYLEITDFSVANHKITVYDQYSMKFVEYDMNTGKYLNSFEALDIYSNICMSDDGFLVAYCSYGLQSSNNKMLTLYHSNTVFNYINKPTYLNERINIEQSSPVSRYEDRIYLTPLFSNFIYCIKSDSVMAKYYIDSGEQQIPKGFYKKFDNENANHILNEIYQSHYVHSIDHFIETENYIYFIFAYKKEDYSAYYDKRTAEFSLYKKTSFSSDNQIWACNNHISNTSSEFISLLYLTNISPIEHNRNLILKKLINVVQETNKEYEFAIAIYKFK